jgi:CII-binding regulator of phage lambda lysogenization HflD
MSNIMSTMPTVNSEKTNLELHVDLCAARYKELDEKVTVVHAKIDVLAAQINQFNANMTKVVVTTAGTIVVAVISLIGVIFTKF